MPPGGGRRKSRAWPGLKCVVVVESQREIAGNITHETRFYITSLALKAQAVGPMVRAHLYQRRVHLTHRGIPLKVKF